MKEFDYVIVGGGLAAASAVDGIREVDREGTIGVFTDEPDPPYHRPPLSKEYFQTPEAPRDLLHVKPSGWFENQSGVTLFTRTRIERLDPSGLTAFGAEKAIARGQRVLLAMGGRPRTLDVPGAELEGVATLRTAADSEKIRTAARHANRVVLVGAGFIGMELASSLKKMDVDPIVVDIRERVWSTVFPEAVCNFLKRYFEERGVPFLLGSGVRAFEGEGRLQRVVLETGEEIPADLAVVGVGMDPNTELAEAAGVAVADGIIVDSFAETTEAHVYAAGDVARFPDPVFGDLTRTEHWDHARAHGKLAGRNMAGARDPYDHVPYFFSHVFDLGINVFGRPETADRTIVSGELDSGRSVVYCVTEGRLSGTILINANDAMEECRNLVRQRPGVDDLLERLENPDTEIGELVG